MNRLLSGYALAQTILEGLGKGVEVQLVMLVNSREDSLMYRQLVRRKCGQQGVTYQEIELLSDTEAAVGQIKSLNDDPSVHGIAVEFPLSRSLDKTALCEAISLSKDVDGIHPHHLGLLMLGTPTIIPSAAHAAYLLLKSTGIVLKSQQAVLVGSSSLVGNPVAQLLRRDKCTVTVTNSETPLDMIQQAIGTCDILITSVGIPGLIKAAWIPSHCVVIDIGTGVSEDGSIRGDVETDQLVCQFITPVPGGVGPVTIAMLIHNVMKCYQMASSKP